MNIPAEELVDWLDEAGLVRGTVTRREMRRDNLLHAVTATLVFHPGGEVYIHQRSPIKDVFPGLWDLCVGGTVVSGESFEENACREISEELGIVGTPVYPLFGHRYQDAHTNSLIRVFATVHGGPVRWQPEEVVQGRWASEAEVMALVARGEMCPDTSELWALYLERFGQGRNFAREVAPTLRPLTRAERPPE